CFAGVGARVALVARGAEGLQDLASRIGGTAHPCDLADPAAVAGLIERIERELGPIDVLVNNAGTDATGSIVTQTAEELERVYRLNLVTPAELCRQVIPRM